MGSYLDVESIIAMLPKPGGASPATSAPTIPPATQPPFVQSPQPVNIQLTVAKDDQGRERYDRDGRPVYVQAPAYGPGYYPPGLPYLPGGGIPGVGGIGSYPGIAGDASVRIGSINSSVTQGNMNWAGEQTLGGISPSSAPSVSGAPLPPPVMMSGPQQLPVVFETPPVVEPSGTRWTVVIFGLCVLVAVAVAAWLLYTRFYKKKKNNAAGTGNNRGNNASGNGRRGNNNNARLDANEFGDFGDLETPGAGGRGAAAR